MKASQYRTQKTNKYSINKKAKEIIAQAFETDICREIYKEWKKYGNRKSSQYNKNFEISETQGKAMDIIKNKSIRLKNKKRWNNTENSERAKKQRKTEQTDQTKRKKKVHTNNRTQHRGTRKAYKKVQKENKKETTECIEQKTTRTTLAGALHI